MPYDYKLMPSPVGQLTLVARDGNPAPFCGSASAPTECAWANCARQTTAGCCWEPSASCGSTSPAHAAHSSWNWTSPAPTFKQVWQALLTIPFGETRSYSQIARQIGNPKAVRAVGAANGEPDLDHCPLPSSDRCVGRPHRLRRRAASQAIFARAGRHRPGGSGILSQAKKTAVESNQPPLFISAQGLNRRLDDLCRRSMPKHGLCANALPA